MVFTEEQIPDQSGKVVIVTGGNSGIGRETCKVLLGKGAKVYLAARSREKAEEAINDIKKITAKEDIHFLPMDLQDLQSVKAAVEAFLQQESRLDLLYNNAGIMASPYSVTKDGYEAQFGTNVVGHFALTKLLLPLMERTAGNSPPGTVRVINVSSMGHAFAPPGGIVFDDLHLSKGYWWPEWKRYGQSKLGNILMTNEIARRYGPSGIYSISLHPGNINTNLTSGTYIAQSRFGRAVNCLVSVFLLSTPQGALTQLYAGTSPEIVEKNLNGAYLVPFAKVGKPSAYAKDAELGEKLWSFLEQEMAEKGIIGE